MRGTMMDFRLTLPTILERAGRIFPRVEMVSRKPDKSITRTCYGEFHFRARRLASSLTKLGMKRGDRVASMNVEPLQTSRSLLRSSMRGWDPAYLEFASSPARNCSDREACRSLPV